MTETVATLLDYALAYSNQGFWVLPISPTGKNPALTSWIEYTKRKPTADEIRRWWSENPEYKIGFVTGRGPRICVLDIDKPEKYAHYVELFPTKLVSRSGGGGYHLFYVYPPGFNDHLPNRFPDEGIDFRGDNGIIVAPPSSHPSGSEYVWISQSTPSVLPESLLRIITSKGHANGKVQEHDRDNWVTDLLRNGSQVGNRNNDGARLAGYFLAKGMPIDIVLSLMQPWYERTDTSGFPQSDLEVIVRSVSNTDLRKSPPTPPLIPLQQVQSFSDFIAGPEVELTWMIEEWLPDATTALMVAPPGTYKTWLMLAIAMSVSTGQKLFGKYEINSPSPVLIIQQEDSKAIIRQRLRTIYTQLCVDCGAGVDLNPVDDGDLELEVVRMPRPELDVFVSEKLIRFADPESMKLLELLIDARGYKLVFIDPLYMSADADNYMSKAAQEMSVLKTLRDKYGVSFCVLHHTKKATEQGSTERSDAWGSQFINAWLESGIQIRPGANPETVKVHRHYKATKAKKQEQVQFTINTEPENRFFKVEIVEEGEVPVGMIALLRDRPRTTDEVADALHVHPHTARRKLVRMMYKNMVIKHGDNSYSLQ